MTHQNDRDLARRSAAIIGKKMAEEDRAREEERARSSDVRRSRGGVYDSAVGRNDPGAASRREQERIESEAAALLPAEWKPTSLLGYTAIIGSMGVVLIGAAYFGNIRNGPAAAGVWGMPVFLILMLIGAAIFERINDRMRTRRFLAARNLALTPRRGLTFLLKRRRRQKELEQERTRRHPAGRTR